MKSVLVSLTFAKRYNILCVFVTLSIYNTHIIYGSYGTVLGGLCSISQMMQAQEGGVGDVCKRKTDL